MLRPRSSSTSLVSVGAMQRPSRAITVEPALPGENFVEKTVWLAGIVTLGYLVFRYVLPAAFSTASHTRAAYHHFRQSKHAAPPAHHPAATLRTGDLPS